MTPFQLHVRRWKGCDKCELACQRDRIVLARGKVPCDVLLIGEAPGQSEDVVGQPFVGPAGKLLDHLIDRAGWNEPIDVAPFEGDNQTRPLVRCAFTNLVACFPKEAKKEGVNEPSDAAIKACTPRLAEFIELSNPQMVVCVGNLASKWMRKVRDQLGDDGLPHLIDIVHPAAILRANESQQGLMKQRVVVQLANVLDKLVPF